MFTLLHLDSKVYEMHSVLHQLVIVQKESLFVIKTGKRGSILKNLFHDLAEMYNVILLLYKRTVIPLLQKIINNNCDNETE